LDTPRLFDSQLEIIEKNYLIKNYSQTLLGVYNYKQFVSKQFQTKLSQKGVTI
jgi:hypothetical protein